MAINPPVSHTTISTAQWGIPITDEVNRLTTAVAALQPGAWVALSYQNGWTNIGGGQQNGQYRKWGDMVQLRGFLQNGTAGTVAFNLPAGFRPPAGIGLVAISFDGTNRIVNRLAMNSSGDAIFEKALTAEINGIAFATI
jgi:hypothetical protein